MKMIKLHRYKTNKPLYINPEFILCFERFAKPYAFTEITAFTDECIQVTETEEEINSLIESKDNYNLPQKTNVVTKFAHGEDVFKMSKSNRQYKKRKSTTSRF